MASYRDADKRVRELSDVFAELARVGRRIPLRGLAPADIEAYVATVTESTVSRRAVARLHEVTGGNPFFLGEVVRLLAAGDTLASLDERDRGSAPAHPRGGSSPDPPPRGGPPSRGRRDAPARGRDRTRIRPASAPAREPAEPRPREAVLAEAAAVGLIAEVAATPRRYSFTHDLVRETLYGDLPPRRRLELHQTVGRLLESAHGDDLDPHLSEIAHHLFLASPLGDAGRAVEYLVARGRSRVRRARLRGCRDPLPARAGAARGRGRRLGRAARRAAPAPRRRAVALGGRQRGAADVRARDRRRAALGRAGDARASGARLRDRARRLPALRAIPGRQRRHGAPRGGARRPSAGRQRAALPSSRPPRPRDVVGIRARRAARGDQRRSDRDGTSPR